MSKRFEDRILEERARMRVTPEELISKIKASSYGPQSKELLNRWVKCESTGEVGFALYSCPPLMERGSGAKVYDADGKEYIDLMSGFSVNNVGLCNPEVVEVIKSQAGKLIQYFDLPTPPRVELSEKLISITPGDFPKKVIYSSTGSEIIEAIVKLVRWYTGKQFILVPYGDYHGRTALAQALTGKGGMWAYHYPVPPADSAVAYFPYPYCYRCPFDKEYPACDFWCVKFLEDMFKSKEHPFRDPQANVSNVAAIVIEPMQCSAGYIIPPTEYLSRLQELCDKYDILLVVDEIQAGMGRTGKMWASEHSGVAPDVVAIAKSLGGGLPLSVAVGRKEIMDSWGPAAHLGTFSGNPLACATAVKVLEIMERDNLPGRAKEMGDYFLDGLKQLAKKHRLIGQVQGKGLLLSIEFVRDAKTKEPAAAEASYMMTECLKERLIFELSGYYLNRFNLIPSLVISREEIDKALKIFDKVIIRAEKKFGLKT